MLAEAGMENLKPIDKTSESSARWRRALIPLETTVQQAIRNLNDSALQIALVVGPNGVLLGTVTDGDIRRGLLRGLELGSPIEAIMQPDALGGAAQTWEGHGAAAHEGEQGPSIADRRCGAVKS